MFKKFTACCMFDSKLNNVATVLKNFALKLFLKISHIFPRTNKEDHKKTP